MVFALTDHAAEMGGDFQIDQVVLVHQDREFICESERQLRSHVMAREMARSRVDDGWEAMYV